MIGARAGVAIDRLLPRGSFARNVGILSGGTVVAQGLMVLSLPILTRLYTPEEFGLLAIYVALLGILSVVSCLRFNIAIPLPERDVDAMHLVALALISAVCISLVLGAIVLLLPGPATRLLGQPAMEPFLWMVPFGVLGAAAYAAFQYWASRKKRFGVVSRTRMSRAVSGAGTQLGFGALGVAPFGLLFGHMVYCLVGVGGLAWNMARNDRAAASRLSVGGLWRALVSYRRFPLFSVPEALFNAAALHVPVIIIGAATAGPQAGFVMVAMQVMSLPMTLVGSSVAQVYLSEAPARYRDGTLGSFTRRTSLVLFGCAAPPLAFVALVAPFVFPWLLGEDWVRAGVLVAWMTPWYLLQFTASPVSVVLHVTNRIGTAMLLQAFGFLVRVGSVLAAASIATQWTPEVYAVSGAIFYGIYIVVICNISHPPNATKNDGVKPK